MYRFGGSSADAGRPVRCSLQTAWDFFGDRGRSKQHTLQKPTFRAEVMPNIHWQIGVDTETIPIGPKLNFGRAAQRSYWDEAEWDQAYWSTAAVAHSQWIKSGGKGHCASTRLTFDVTDSPVSLRTITYLMIGGGLT